MTAAATYTLARIRKGWGFKLGDLREFERRGWLPIMWTGPRKGYVLAEDWDRFLAERHDRSRRWVEQQACRLDYIKGSPIGDELPDFLRKQG